MSDEEWRPVVGYEGLYEVSSHGRVRGLPRVGLNGRALPLRTLTPITHPKGYVHYDLRREGSSSRVLAHRVVCHAFHGGAPTPDHTDVCHINEVKSDNRAENLRWGTRRENIRQYAASGRYRNQNTEKTNCNHGHPLSGDNLRVWKNPRRGTTHRICKTCASENSRKSRGTK